MSNDNIKLSAEDIIPYITKRYEIKEPELKMAISLLTKAIIQYLVDFSPHEVTPMGFFKVLRNNQKKMDELFLSKTENGNGSKAVFIYGIVRDADEAIIRNAAFLLQGFIYENFIEKRLEISSVIIPEIKEIPKKTNNAVKNEPQKKNKPFEQVNLSQEQKQPTSVNIEKTQNQNENEGQPPVKPSFLAPTDVGEQHKQHGIQDEANSNLNSMSMDDANDKLNELISASRKQGEAKEKKPRNQKNNSMTDKVMNAFGIAGNKANPDENEQQEEKGATPKSVVTKKIKAPDGSEADDMDNISQRSDLEQDNFNQAEPAPQPAEGANETEGNLFENIGTDIFDYE